MRLLIFDLDGTLVDTIEDITASLNVAIAPEGLPPIALDDAKAIVGEGVRNLIERALGPGREARIDATLARFREHYGAHIADRSYVYHGVREAWAALTDTRKAVLSNKSYDMCRLLLDKLGLMDHVDLLLGGDSVSAKKPAPDGIIHAMDTLGCLPEETVMVGDSVFDIGAARAAGVRVIAVSYGYRPRHMLTGADRVIENMGELPEAIIDIFG